MAQTIPKITITGIPALLPNGFSDSINNNTFRIEARPVYDLTEVLSDRPIALSDEQTIKEFRKLQTIAYNTWQTFINVDENTPIGNLEIGETITIETTNSDTLDVVVTSLTVSRIDKTSFSRIDLSFRERQADALAINNYYTKANIRSAENGGYADGTLNQLTIAPNPEWAAARAKGTVFFTAGFDASVTNHDFKMTNPEQPETTITLDANYATQQALVDAINTKLTAAGFTLVECYNGGRFIGFRTNAVGAGTPTFTLAAGTVNDDFLVDAGITAAVYTGQNPIDATFAAANNSITFYSKIHAYFKEIRETTETEDLDGIKIPIYSNDFLTLELDFILDDSSALYGNLTELQAFDYYVGQTWYKDTSGNDAGETIKIYNGSTQDTYTPVEPLTVEKIENESLVNAGIRRVIAKYAQSQNFRYRT